MYEVLLGIKDTFSNLYVRYLRATALQRRASAEVYLKQLLYLKAFILIVANAIEEEDLEEDKWALTQEELDNILDQSKEITFNLEKTYD